jgi:hypothetical protein
MALSLHQFCDFATEKGDSRKPKRKKETEIAIRDSTEPEW